MAGREIVINELSCFPRLFRLLSTLHDPSSSSFFSSSPPRRSLSTVFVASHSSSTVSPVVRTIYSAVRVLALLWVPFCMYSLGYSLRRVAETARVRARRKAREVIRDRLAGTPPSCSVAGTSGLLLADR